MSPFDVKIQGEEGQRGMYADYSAQYLLNHGNVDPDFISPHKGSQHTLHSKKSETHLMINQQKKFTRSPPLFKPMDPNKAIKSKYMRPKQIKQTINTMLNETLSKGNMLKHHHDMRQTHYDEIVQRAKMA
jgi:hypothetical protein